jgi:hypothetical protein
LYLGQSQGTSLMEDIQYTMALNNLTNLQENVVKANLMQSFGRIGSSNVSDTPLFTPNLAGLTTWWQQKNTEPWKAYITVLYSMVNSMLGLKLTDQYVASYLQSNYFTSVQSMSSYLFTSVSPPPQATLDAMYNDPWYGLSNTNNYARWMMLNYPDDYTQANSTWWEQKQGF